MLHVMSRKITCLVPFLLFPILLASSQCALADQTAVYSVTESNSDKNKENVDKKLTLGKDFFSVEEPELISIYDLSKRCIFLVSPKKKIYMVVDLHAPVYFKFTELQNRMMIQGALDAVSVKDNPVDLCDTETLFGICLPGQRDATKNVKVISGGENGEYKFAAGHGYASFVSSAITIDPACEHSHRCFLAHECRIHPEVRKAMLNEHKLPQRLTYKYRNDPDGSSEVEFILKTTSTDGQRPEIPRDCELHHRVGLTAVYSSLETKMKEGKIPTKAEAIDSSTRSYRAGKNLDAVLTLLEYGLETGDQLSDELRKLSQDIEHDSQCKKFLNSLTPTNAREAQEAWKNLESIDRKKLDKGYVVDIMQGNIASQLGDSSTAKSLFIDALVQNPFLVGAYHDLAQAYLKEFDFTSAWDCLALARKLNPSHPMLKDFEQVDQKLETDLPDFF